MFQYSKLTNGVEFNISFIDKINIIKGSSGTGKTFLFNTIASYCVSNKISYALIDYKIVASGDESLILSHCRNKSLIILDNADLYLTSELFNNIINLKLTIILSIKATFGLNMENAHLYTVTYKDSLLKTRRVC